MGSLSHTRTGVIAVLFSRIFALGCVAGWLGLATAGAAEPVSYDRQIRPIFQAHCQGCHQPAKAGGGYVMTEFARLLDRGDSDKAGIVPGQAAQSELIAQITPEAGKAKMPKNAPPLHESERELIARWIAEGAKNDRASHAGTAIDAEHPPIYTRPPVITAIDYSPDGKLLAVAGFHEVLLTDPAQGSLVARLVGLSERVQALRFSPDGAKLAVIGGNPGRFGELQVWNVPRRKLLLSKAVGFDTLHGVDWSPDGRLISVGCPDNTVRVFDAGSGEQVLQQGAHTDWVLGTAFTRDGSHLISVGRDMTAKLTEVATQRFVDNITSITPGVLKGGIQAVARHPSREEFVVGGADGVPKVYRVFRTSARKIGDDANLIRELPALQGRIFDVAISRDGRRVVAVSALDSGGQVLIAPYPIEPDPKVEARIKQIESKPEKQRSAAEKAELVKLRAVPPQAAVVPLREIPAGLYGVAFRPDGEAIACAGSDGQIRIFSAQDGKPLATYAAAPLTEPKTDNRVARSVDFIRDVNPVLSRLGCNQGTCHGSAQGKNGFKLSLRGYDPVFDVRALTDDLASRRVNVAAPDDSLMLLKATGAVPHAGKQLITPRDPYYQLLRDWIAGGARLNPESPRVARIEIAPLNPIIEKPGGARSFEVQAIYADGSRRNVTAEAFIESGNGEVATASPRGGVLTAVRRGEAPILARYEGAYAATTLTVMGDRQGFVWSDPPKNNRVDELTAAKWKRLKIAPSPLCTEEEFLRRVMLDLTGLPPSVEEVRAFLADPRDSRVKRDELVDRLVGSPAYIEYWTNKWADLLQVNRKFLGAEGAAAFRAWIRGEVAANRPYDQFVRSILNAQGSNREHPEAAYYKILREPTATMENTTHLFLGVRFNCNKCHDHPFERWTQDQYYHLSAFFARTALKPDPAAGDKKVGGTAVEGAKPLFEIVSEKPDGEVKHDRTGAVAEPRFPFPARADAGSAASRREQLAAWITSPDNPYFARSYVNRLWGYLFGVGIIEPIDDIRAGNPPTNPELLDFLTEEFVAKGFDIRHMHRLICKSRTYQLSVTMNRWNADDRTNFSHALARRLPAEVLYDTVQRAVGATSRFPGVPAGTRAAELPDSGIDLPSGFLEAFGRPNRESACECERGSGLQLGPVMALINGQTIAEAIADPKNALADLVAREPDDRRLIEALFLRILNRPATPEELTRCLPALTASPTDHARLTASLKALEDELAPAQLQQEKEREQAAGLARTELLAYERDLAPRLAVAEKQRQERLAKAESAVKAYERDLPRHVEAWTKRHESRIPWKVLPPKSMQAANGAKLTRQDDGSIVAEGKNGKGNYVITAETDLTEITAIQLEALADERLPKGGPGRAVDGNFVLNQLTLSVAPKGQPKAAVPVALHLARADFSQENYDVAGAFDGQVNGGKGWAVSPSFGVTHWAVIELKQPLTVAPDSLLTFTFQQQFGQGQHTLGRFRLLATGTKDPVSLGVAESYRELLARPADQRDPKQRDLLARYVQSVDPESRKLRKDLAEAKQPLPIDPKLKALREQLAEAQKPIPEDPRLARLRKDVAQSATQAAQTRLTGAQDIAWALINSPAFLFNH